MIPVIPVIHKVEADVIDVTELDTDLCPVMLQIVKCSVDNSKREVQMFGEEILTFGGQENADGIPLVWQVGDVMFATNLVASDNSLEITFLIDIKTGDYGAIEAITPGEVFVKVLKGSFVVEN